MSQPTEFFMPVHRCYAANSVYPNVKRAEPFQYTCTSSRCYPGDLVLASPSGAHLGFKDRLGSAVVDHIHRASSAPHQKPSKKIVTPCLSSYLQRPPHCIQCCNILAAVQKDRPCCAAFGQFESTPHQCQSSREDAGAVMSCTCQCSSPVIATVNRYVAVQQKLASKLPVIDEHIQVSCSHCGPPSYGEYDSGGGYEGQTATCICHEVARSHCQGFADDNSSLIDSNVQEWHQKHLKQLEKQQQQVPILKKIYKIWFSLKFYCIISVFVLP